MYSILDRNELSVLYAPVTRGSGTLLADRRSRGQSRQSAPVSIARSQSPDQDEPDRQRPRRGESDRGDVMIPPPSLLGIADPTSQDASESPRAASTTTRRTAWHPMPIEPGETERKSFDRTEPTHLRLDPAADNDRFGPIPQRSHDEDDDAQTESARSAPDSTSDATAPSKSRWRRVRTPGAEPVDGAGER
jgi:hypothetical protein